MGMKRAGVAVTVWKKPFVDLYDIEGELYTIYPLWYDSYINNNKRKKCLVGASTTLKFES